MTLDPNVIEDIKLAVRTELEYFFKKLREEMRLDHYRVSPSSYSRSLDARGKEYNPNKEYDDKRPTL